VLEEYVRADGDLCTRGDNYEGPTEEEDGPVEGKIHFRPEEDDKPGERGPPILDKNWSPISRFPVFMDHGWWARHFGS
jgi:hypothetical protein